MRYYQTTFVNGEQKYTPHYLSSDEMVERLAQVLVLRQAGTDITLHRDVDEMWRVTRYIVSMTHPAGRIIRHTYDVIRDDV